MSSVRAGTSVVIDHDDVEWQPCHFGRGSGREQPGECADDSHDMVGGGRTPPFAVWLGGLGPDWIRARDWPGMDSRLDPLRDAPTFVGRTSGARPAL